MSALRWLLLVLVGLPVLGFVMIAGWALGPVIQWLDKRDAAKRRGDPRIVKGCGPDVWGDVVKRDKGVMPNARQPAVEKSGRDGTHAVAGDASAKTRDELDTIAFRIALNREVRGQSKRAKPQGWGSLGEPL